MLVAGGPSRARRPVFVDEMGANTSLAPLSAWTPEGEGLLYLPPYNPIEGAFSKAKAPLFERGHGGVGRWWKR